MADIRAIIDDQRPFCVIIAANMRLIIDDLLAIGRHIFG